MGEPENPSAATKVRTLLFRYLAVVFQYLGTFHIYVPEKRLGKECDMKLIGPDLLFGYMSAPILLWQPESPF
jgi:hypothetical protein